MSFVMLQLCWKVIMITVSCSVVYTTKPNDQIHTTNASAAVALFNGHLSGPVPTVVGGNESGKGSNTSLIFNSEFDLNRTEENDSMQGSIFINEPDLSWQISMKMVCVPLFVVLGLIGNGLSFLVMCSRTYLHRSYAYYLRALAVCDSLVLVITLVTTGNEIAVHLGYGGYLGGHTTATCKITEFLEHVVYLMSSWLVVCFTFDRWIAVCHPLQRARLCTGSRALYIIFGLLLVLMLTQAFRLVYITRLERYQPCHAPRELRLEFFGIHYLWFSFFLRFFCPFIIICACNGCIIFHIQRMHHRNRAHDRPKNATSAIYTLFALCILFVLTLLPNAVISAMLFAEMMLKGHIRDMLFTLLKYDAPFQMVRLINYMANMLLYGLTGRQFRHELCKLLHRYFPCRDSLGLAALELRPRTHNGNNNHNAKSPEIQPMNKNISCNKIMAQKGSNPHKKSNSNSK